MPFFSKAEVNLILMKLDALLAAQANDDQDFLTMLKAILTEVEEIEHILKPSPKAQSATLTLAAGK